MTFPGQILIDDLIGNRVALNPGQRITLGRAAQFPLAADDEFMHRMFLQFWDADGTWMVTNLGTRITASIEPRAENPSASCVWDLGRPCRCRWVSPRWSSPPR